MAFMDTTHDGDIAKGTADELLEQLAAVDPAEAPPIAERLATILSRELDEPAASEDPS